MALFRKNSFGPAAMPRDPARYWILQRIMPRQAIYKWAVVLSALEAFAMGLSLGFERRREAQQVALVMPLWQPRAFATSAGERGVLPTSCARGSAQKPESPGAGAGVKQERGRV